jgi:hypothetical protein
MSFQGRMNTCQPLITTTGLSLIGREKGSPLGLSKTAGKYSFDLENSYLDAIRAVKTKTIPTKVIRILLLVHRIDKSPSV